MAGKPPTPPDARFAVIMAAAQRAKKGATPAPAIPTPRPALPHGKPEPDRNAPGPQAGRVVSPFSPTTYMHTKHEKPGPGGQVQPRGGAAGAPKPGGPVEVSLVSSIGVNLFGMKKFDLVGVLKRKKEEIRQKFPDLEKVGITLMLENGNYSVSSYEPAGLREMLAYDFEAVLKAPGEAGGSKEYTYICRFEYALGAAAKFEAPAIDRAHGPAHSSIRSANLLGAQTAAHAANDTSPEVMDIGNYYPVPDSTGYAFMLFGTDRKMKLYEVSLAEEDEISHTFRVSKVVDGKRSGMGKVTVGKDARDERYGFPDEGIEISFSTFKGGSRSIRVDPFDATRENEAPAGHTLREKAAAAMALVTAGGLFAYPDISAIPAITRYLDMGQVPETVAIGSYVIPTRQIFAAAAAALLATVAGLIRLSSRNDTNPGDAQ
jgi:hypothetical protein